MGRYFWDRAGRWFEWFGDETYVGIFKDSRDCVKYEVFIGSYEECLKQAEEFAFKHQRILVGIIGYAKAVRMRDKLRGFGKTWESILREEN